MTEKKESKEERRERRRAEVVLPLVMLGGLVSISGAAWFSGNLTAIERTGKKISGLCGEVDSLKCTEAKCAKMKQTCEDFRAGQLKQDYEKVARELSKGLEKMKVKPRTTKGMQMRMK